MRGFIFVNSLSEYQDITGVIAAACCKTAGSLERDMKEGGRTKFQERSEGPKRSAVGRPRVFSEAISPANHEGDDCDFWFASTGCDKLHPCAKIQVGRSDIRPSHA